MKRLKIFFLGCMSVGLIGMGFANISNSQRQVLNRIEKRALNVYEKDINKAYEMKNATRKLIKEYRDSTNMVYALAYIYRFTDRYIQNNQPLKEDQDQQVCLQVITYAKSPDGKIQRFPNSCIPDGWEKVSKDTYDELQEQKDIDDGNNNKNEPDEKLDDNENQNSKPIFQIDKDIENNRAKYKYLDRNNTDTLISLELEPTIDHIYLVNIYMENQGSLEDFQGVVKDVYVLNGENQIVGDGYIEDDILVLDIDDYLIRKDEYEKIYIEMVFNEPANTKQTGSIKLSLCECQNFETKSGTSKGIRARFYSNGNYIELDKKYDIDSEEKLLTKSFSMLEKLDFEPNYSEALAFRINNNGNSRLELESFKFRVDWSNIPVGTEFILKDKSSNDIVGKNTIENVDTKYITINYNNESEADDFISHKSSMDLVLEINHKTSGDGTRYVRLENMVIGDGFGGEINNLNDYSNTGLPTDWYSYKY